MNAQENKIASACPRSLARTDKRTTVDMKEKEHSISYITDGEGKWWKIVGQPQCVDESFPGGRCQGVDGHKGCHWAYQPNGSYSYWLNEADPGSLEAGVGAGLTPPDSDSYIHPLEKVKEHYIRFQATEEVLDKQLIQRLERDDPPEENASIDRPLSEDEYRKLVEEGVISRVRYRI